MTEIWKFCGICLGFIKGSPFFGFLTGGVMLLDPSEWHSKARRSSVTLARKARSKGNTGLPLPDCRDFVA